MEWWPVLLSLLIGVALGWVLGSGRSKSSTASTLREHETKVSAAEARIDEMRQQLDAARRDFETLREKLTGAETVRAAAEAKARETEKNIADQRALLEDARAKLTDAFKSLAADALAGNNRGFLTLAEERFRAIREGTAVELDLRKKAIEDLVQPLAVTLTVWTAAPDPCGGAEHAAERDGEACQRAQKSAGKRPLGGSCAP